MTLRDPEVLDLLADDPRLLALADAVAATQQAPRRPLLHRAGPRVAAVAVVAAAVVVVAWWSRMASTGSSTARSPRSGTAG